MYTRTMDPALNVELASLRCRRDDAGRTCTMIVRETRYAPFVQSTPSSVEHALEKNETSSSLEEASVIKPFDPFLRLFEKGHRDSLLGVLSRAYEQSPSLKSIS